MVMLCTTFISAPITIGIGVFLAVREDGPLSLILLAAIPVLLASIGLIIVRVVPRFRDMQVRIDRVNQVLREQIVGIRVIRAFVREPVETDRFGEANDRLTRTATVTSRYMSSMFPTVMFVLNVSSAAAIWIAGDRISGGEMKIGALIAFLTYLVQILMAVMMATFVAVMWPRAAVCADRVLEVLDTDSSIVTATRPVDSIAGTGALEFRDVSFSYPGAEKPVLSNISFTALPGQTTAIIGSTGSGKTSLVNLIARLIDTSEGTVLVDGVDVRELDPEVLWRSVAIVPQKPYLFSGTIRSNLLFADPDATEADLWKALEIAQAADFVNAMPERLDAPISQDATDAEIESACRQANAWEFIQKLAEGLDTRVGEGGSNLSGGQRQRLAIARALVRRPSIHVFDDSFSALDLATDSRLRTALVPLTADRTMIVVAQRVSTIRHADQILVLEHGECIGLGTHEELIETCPTYAEIVASQLTAEEAA